MPSPKTRPTRKPPEPAGFGSPRVAAMLEKRRLALDPAAHSVVFVVWTAGNREPFAAVADEATAHELAAAAARPGRAVCVFRAALASTYSTAAPEVIRVDHPGAGHRRQHGAQA